jgi:ABC-type branched-subunit amino acid transport system substrate-binding protein
MTKQRTPVSRGLVAIAIVLALVGAACGNASDDKPTAAPAPSGTGGSGAAVPGVTADEIRFSAIGTNSNNPLGTCVLDCFDQGVKAYFDYRNSEGGIYGKKLVLSKELDDELSKNQEKALEVITANDTFGNFNAPQLASGWADLANAGIPTYVWAINPAQASGHDQIFGNAPVQCISCTARYYAQIAKTAGAKKIATLGYGVSDNSKQCSEAAAASLKQYSDDAGGAEAVYTRSDLDFGLPNGIAPEVSAIKSSGADLVIGCLDLNGMKTLSQEMERQGIGDVKLLHPNTYDQTFVKDNAELFEGDYVLVQFRPFEAEAGSSSLDAFKEWMGKNGNTITELSMLGWINADLAYQGIKAAGENFDRQSVIDATNKLTSYTADGLIAPIDWSRQHVAPTQDDPATHGPNPDCFALVQVKDGAFQMVGDSSKPWMCWPGDTRDWSEPTSMDFAS